MNLEELMASTPPMQQHALIKGFQAGAASRDAEITELKAERDTFYMDYRIKCDVETKAAHVERDQLREQLEEMTGKNLVNQNAVRLQKEKVAELREQVKLLREEFQTYIDEHEECEDADGWMAMLCSVEAHHVASEALAATIPVATMEMEEG